MRRRFLDWGFFIESKDFVRKPDFQRIWK